MALFDIRVVDTNAKSYLSHSPIAVLASAKTEKNSKRKYCDACTEHRATFTLLCFSVDGLVGDKAAYFLKHLGRSLSVAWECHYGEVIRWLRLNWHLLWFKQLMFVLGGQGLNDNH